MGWHTATIGDLCSLRSGGTPSRKNSAYYGGDIPWVKIGDLDSPTGLIESTEESITTDGLAAIGNRVFDEGTVLFAMYASVGKTAVAGTRLATNQAILGVSPKDPKVLDARYLYQWFKHAQPSLAAYTNQGTQKNLSATIVQKFLVPLPPIDEQRRIADLLDEADRLQRLRKAANEKVQRILPALFLDMFGDPETNPMGWQRRTLGELIKVKSGDFLPAKSMNHDGAYPVYGGNGVTGHHDEFMFAAPTIVIGRVGQACGSVHHTEPKSWVTDNALSVSLLNGDLAERYLVDALTMANLRQVAAHADLPSLSGARLAPVVLMVPPLEVQQRYASLRTQVLGALVDQSAASARLAETATVLRSRLFAEST